MDRAAAACDALGVPTDAATIVVACSGGADSAAALHIIRRARPKARIIACYIDHRVRPAASIARDVRAFRKQARACHAQSEVLRLEEVPRRGESTEATMRAARYSALASFAASVGSTVVATGHHRDDLAETMLLALVRGSGVDGLAAMRPRRSIGHGVDVVRPLLWASKSALARFARAEKLEVSVDETNVDRRYRRNAIRALLAGLEAAAPGASQAIARSAAIVSGDKALLDWLTRSAWERCAVDRAGVLSAAALRALPAALLRRVVRHAVAIAAGTARDFSYKHCAAIVKALKDRRGGSFHAGSVRATLSGGRLAIKAIGPGVRSDLKSVPDSNSSEDVIVPARSTSIRWQGGRIDFRLKRPKPHEVARARSRASNGRLYLDGSVLFPGSLVEIRNPKPGDRMVPRGRRTAVSLARFLAKEGIARDDRTAVPLLCHEGSIAAVLGVRASEPFASRPGRAVLEVGWTPPKAFGLTHTADE